MLVGALAGIRPATSGTVCDNGRDLYRNAALFRTALGYVPQEDIIHTALPIRALSGGQRRAISTHFPTVQVPLTQYGDAFAHDQRGHWAIIAAFSAAPLLLIDLIRRRKSATS